MKFRALKQAFNKLNAREQIAVTIAGVAALAVGLYLSASAISESISETKRKTIVRTRELEEIHRIVNRHRTLTARLDKIKQTFADSQMTFEQVTDQLDKIVKESIGSQEYDLKRGRTAKVGLDYEKQDLTLKVKSLTLEQTVKLLHSLEQGKSPLFLGKVDLLKSSRDQSFGATLEIFSIRKS